MIKAILKPVVPFDKNNSNKFYFDYYGNQPIKNRLIIKDNITNKVVYNKIQETLQFYHILPSNILTNGNVYNAQISIFDKEGNESDLSNVIIFYCFTTPLFSFSNLNDSTNQIQNSNYELQLQYSQVENEPLNYYKIILYNFNQNEVFNSGNLYNTETLKYLLTSLLNNTQYYVQAVGQTLNGINIDTGLIHIVVRYISPSVFSLVQLENLPFDASVKVDSRFVKIVGKSNPDPPKFIDDKRVDLTDSDSYVEFDKGFNISDNFTLEMLVSSLTDYSIFYEHDDGKYKMELKYMRGKFDGYNREVGYVILRIYNSLTNYVVMSNYINIPRENDNIYIFIKKIGGLCDVIIDSPTSDDRTEAPGNKNLLGGTMQAGYFGIVSVNDLINGDALASLVDISDGISQFSNEGWLKFAYKNNIQFIAKKPIKSAIKYNSLISANCVDGSKTIKINGLTYKVRLMKGANIDPVTDVDDGSQFHNSEWNKLILPINNKTKNRSWLKPENVENDIEYWGIDFTEEDLYTHYSCGNGSSTLCQEISLNGRICRGGFFGIAYSAEANVGFNGGSYGWRPVLELVE